MHAGVGGASPTSLPERRRAREARAGTRLDVPARR
jgi:hypothetical protein